MSSSARSSSETSSAKPSSSHQSMDEVLVLQKMSDLNEKLSIIDYQKDFVAMFKCPTINQYYFCRQTNQAQQFHTFCCLASYLINKLIGTFELKVDGFDDPNLTIDKLLSSAKNYIDVSSYVQSKAKLKQGFGPEVIMFLTNLFDKYWLEKQPLPIEETIQIKIFNNDGTVINDDDDLDEDSDDDVNNVEIELEEEFSDYIMPENNDQQAQHDKWEEEFTQNTELELDLDMIEANTNLTEWKLELERVLPQLNARSILRQQQQGGMFDYDWRLHFKAAQNHQSNIKAIFDQTETMLRQINSEIGLSLEKIKSKENYLYQNLNTLLAEWSNVRAKAVSLQQSYEESNAEVSAKSARLQELNDEDRTVKQSIEEYSLRLTDSSSLMEAKKARETLKQDLIKMNLQIGVAMQTLVRHVTSMQSSLITFTN